MTISTCARCRDDASCIATYTTTTARKVEYLCDRCAAPLDPAVYTVGRITNRLIAPGSQRKNAA